MPLAQAAKKAGYEVVVVTRVRAHGERIRQAGIRLVPFDQDRRTVNPFLLISTIIRLACIYRRERPNIVHNVSLGPIVISSISALLSGNIKIVNALTGLGWVYGSSNFLAMFSRSVLRVILKRILVTGTVIVQNSDDKLWLLEKGLKASNIKLIRGSGVDTRRFRPVLRGEFEGGPIVVLVARMLWDKGIKEFVEAARMLQRRGSLARFVLVGVPDGSNRACISKQKLEEWVEEGVVEWWGYREDMELVYQKCVVACLPSYREGLPKSLLEALASGLPVVSTNVPGCREVVLDGVNGFLVPPKDASSLANAIDALLQNYDLREAMGKYGRRLVENEFSIDTVANATLELYHEIT